MQCLPAVEILCEAWSWAERGAQLLVGFQHGLESRHDATRMGRLAPGQVTCPGLVYATVQPWGRREAAPAPAPHVAVMGAPALRGSVIGAPAPHRAAMGAAAPHRAAMGAPACMWEGSALPQHQPLFTSSFNYYMLMKVFL